MNREIESYEIDDYKVVFRPDEFAENPREFQDNLGTIVYWHRNLFLGDVNGEKEYGSPEQFVEQYNDAIMLPVYLYNHSVQRLSIEPFIGRAPHVAWDSGQVGWIYVTEEGLKRWQLDHLEREEIKGILKGEIEEFDAWASGSFIEWSLYKRCPECDNYNFVDGCGRFWSLAEAKGDVRVVVEHHMELDKEG